MRLTHIPVKRSIFGALCSLLVAVSGCTETITEPVFKSTFVYHNETEVYVRLEVYVKGRLMRIWNIEQDASLEQVFLLGMGQRFINRDAIQNYDTARVVFGDTKELWCRKIEQNAPYNIYNYDNMTMTEIEKRHLKYDFHIDDAMMNAATAIESTP